MLRKRIPGQTPDPSEDAVDSSWLQNSRTHSSGGHCTVSTQTKFRLRRGWCQPTPIAYRAATGNPQPLLDFRCSRGCAPAATHTQRKRTWGWRVKGELEGCTFRVDMITFHCIHVWISQEQRKLTLKISNPLAVELDSSIVSSIIK